MFTTELLKTINGHIRRVDLRQHKRERKTVGKPVHGYHCPSPSHAMLRADFANYGGSQHEKRSP